jgi:SnoaL-like domain
LQANFARATSDNEWHPETRGGHHGFMASPQNLMNGVLGMWMQSNPPTRYAAMEELFRHDIVFHYGDAEYVGFEAIEGLSDEMQSRYPGAKFTLTAASTVGNAVRASWTLKAADGHEIETGTYFATLEGGKICSLYAFVDRAGRD